MLKLKIVLVKYKGNGKQEICMTNDYISEGDELSVEVEPGKSLEAVAVYDSKSIEYEEFDYLIYLGEQEHFGKAKRIGGAK